MLSVDEAAQEARSETARNQGARPAAMADCAAKLPQYAGDLPSTRRSTEHHTVSVNAMTREVW